MDMADMGAIAALLSVPVAFASAWWSKRGAERAADAALTAGRHQAVASLAAVQVQAQNQREQRRRAQLGDVAAEFLRATDSMIRTVKQLPDVEQQQRKLRLLEYATAVEDAYAPLELMAPPDLLSAAEHLRERCQYLEKVAVDRAVLRFAIAALERRWCPRDAETCEDDRHNAAHLAWDFLVGWANKEEEERWNDRDLLDFCLRDSGILTGTQVDQTLALADECPSTWNQLIGGWIRDPLIESAESARDAFVTAARTAAPPNGFASNPG
ncbi:hypothetical protein [Streptomyces luteireticuli]|uniref:Uncharacterized protein n=1 Tax=Streptomyces luteireticuli TaxID=173858 RepID=A0ABP3IR38_9ACTN